MQVNAHGFQRKVGLQSVMFFSIGVFILVIKFLDERASVGFGMALGLLERLC
jgi:hypothetical protein